MFNCKRKVALVLGLIIMAFANNYYMAKAYDNDSGYDTYLEMINEDSEKKNNIKKVEATNNEENVEVNQIIDEKMIEKELKNPVYDDYKDEYAGKYVNDAGEIVVCSCDIEKTTSFLEEVEDSIDIIEAEFSLDHLVKIKNSIDEKLLAMDNANKKGLLILNEKKLYDNIVVVSISVKDNCVMVEFLKDSSYYRNLFEKIIASDDSIKYGTSKAVKDTAVTGLQLGRAIYKFEKQVNGMIYNTRCSIGYPAMHYNANGDKVYGFITCAHGLEKGDKIYLDGACSKCIGKVTKWKLSGNVDAAFVKITNSKYKTSRKVYYNNSTGKTGGGVTISGQSWYYDKDSSQGSSYNPAAGEKAWKAGSTTYLTSGKIVDTWATTRTETGTITDVYKTNIKVEGGDSGGVFFQKDDCKEYSVMGILKSSGSGYSYYVRIENIQKALGLYILGYDLYHGKTVK